MKLLDNFHISPFFRIIWVSESARKMWEKPVRDCSAMVHELELLSVVEGHRLCGWQSINIRDLPYFEHKCASMGLTTLVVRYSKGFSGFAHCFEPAINIDNTTNVPVIFSKSVDDAEAYRKAYDEGDHDKQGYYLGFPKCCRTFFADVWAKGYYDPIWQMAERDNPHPYSNPILRYAGLRVGFHIPCSFRCGETIQLANERMNLAHRKFPQEAKLLDALLSMPTSWDCLRGIAVVRTPIFYIITSSVPCVEKHVVEIDGRFIPKEAAPGLVFPFNKVVNQ